MVMLHVAMVTRCRVWTYRFTPAFILTIVYLVTRLIEEAKHF